MHIKVKLADFGVSGEMNQGMDSTYCVIEYKYTHLLFVVSGKDNFSFCGTVTFMSVCCLCVGVGGWMNVVVENARVRLCQCASA